MSDNSFLEVPFVRKKQVKNVEIARKRNKTIGQKIKTAF